MAAFDAATGCMECRMGSTAGEVHQLKDVQLLGCMSILPGQATPDNMRLLVISDFCHWQALRLGRIKQQIMLSRQRFCTAWHTARPTMDRMLA